MMRKMARLAVLGVVATFVLPAALMAQYPSEVVGFNDAPLGDPSDLETREMFRDPEWSGSSAGYVVNNETGYENNASFRSDALAVEGLGCMEVFFDWVDAADPEAWVRLTTFDVPVRPNPALHTQGKVRFQIVNRSQMWLGQIGLCLGIRETGAMVPQLGNGTTSGDIEWVGVDTTLSCIVDGSTNGLETTVAGDDVLISTNGTSGLIEAINYGPNKVLDSVPAGDDIAYYGFFVATNGTRTPIPALIVPVSAAAASVEWDLSTGQVSFNGGAPAGGIAPMTGNGILDAPNNRGTLEHIAVTNVITDSATGIDIGIDSLQFEAPVPDPVLPPSVVAPIIADDTEVTVTDLALNVDQVVLYLNDSPIATEDVTNNDDVVFTVAPAVTGDVYTATQREGGVVSDFSDGVTVLPEASPYSFSLLIDEDGDGGCTTGWEWVGVDSVSGWVPQGQFIFTNDAVWQVVDVPLDDPALVKAGLGGNGSLDPSDDGIWNIESLWFSIAPGANSNGMGPHEVFIDEVQLLDEFGVVTETILDMEDGVNRIEKSRGQSPTSPTSSALSTASAYDGNTSHRLLWTFSATEDTSLGMLQRTGYACDTNADVPDTTATIRFHMLCRGKPTNPGTPIPVVTGPIVVGNQDTVQVTNDAAATSVQLYVNGAPAGPAVTPTGETTDFAGLTLAVGDSISATQTIGTNGASDYAYPKVVVGGPVPPIVGAPIPPGSTGVTVSNLYVAPYATTTEVQVFVNDVLAGTIAGGTESVVVPVAVLAQNDLVTAKQLVNGVLSDVSNTVKVEFPVPMFYMAPSESDPTIRVQDIYPGVTEVKVATTNGLKVFTADPAGADYVDVPVSGLVAGDVIVATQSVGALESEDSEMEIVTVGTSTVILCDDFEYDQSTYETQWLDDGKPRPELSTEQNATVGGAKSLYSASSTSNTTAPRVKQTLTGNIVADAQTPIVWNVNFYDAHGPGASNVQFAQLNGQGSGLWFYQHVGMLSWAGQDTNYYQYRAVGHGGPNWVDLAEHDAPTRSLGWHTFTIVLKGDRIDAYVDGKLSLKNLQMTSPPVMDTARIGGGYTSAGDAYYDDFCIKAGSVEFGEIEDQKPVPPAVASPLVHGDETVTVKALADDITEVTVYDATPAAIGSYTMTPADTNGFVAVPLSRPLVHLESITATQSNMVGESIHSAALEVGNQNGDILISLGVYDEDNQIEWIGASTVGFGAPQGIAISPSDSWQTITFDPAGPVTAFVGDGVLTGTTGRIEHLAVAVNSTSPDRSAGPYTLYVDNIVNVGAGAGGADVVITGFEGYAYGDEVLFQEPTYSGSTGGDMASSPSASGVVNYHPNEGDYDYVLRWFWKDTTMERWARITSYAVDNLARPEFDLTKPVRMDILLVEKPTVKGDMDGNCTIGLDDLAAFCDNCLNGPDGAINLGDCLDADFNDDGVVDLVDFAAFQRDFSNGFPVLDCVE